MAPACSEAPPARGGKRNALCLCSEVFSPSPSFTCCRKVGGLQRGLGAEPAESRRAEGRRGRWEQPGGRGRSGGVGGAPLTGCLSRAACERDGPAGEEPGVLPGQLLSGAVASPALPCTSPGRRSLLAGPSVSGGLNPVESKRSSGLCSSGPCQALHPNKHLTGQPGNRVEA